MPAVIVAIEQRFPKDQRIIADDLAYAMLPSGMKAFVWLMRPAFARDWMVRATEKSAPGLWALMACRKRYIDEKLIEAVDEIDAVVNLGAGFDTRVYRLPALADLPAWEIDQPENIAPKRLRLGKLFGAIPPSRQPRADRFRPAGLGCCADSARLLRGQAHVFYLRRRHAILDARRPRRDVRISGKGRARQPPDLHPRTQGFPPRKGDAWRRGRLQKLRREGVWLFGMEPDRVEPFLDPFGWRVIEHIGYQELVDRYVRPTGRELASTPVERMVYAEKL
jgi:O-methyltransferase involved in polyketide biosynthesis